MIKPSTKPTGGDPGHSVLGMELGRFKDLENRFTQILMRRVRSEYRQDIPDFLQEAYVRFLSRAAQDDGAVIRDPGGYIWAIVVHYAAEQIRLEERALASPKYSSQSEEGDSASCAGESWNSAADTAGEIDDLIDAINRLPKLRRAILLLVIAGYSYPEIAGELEVSEHTVKSYLKKARAELRAQFFDRKAGASSDKVGDSPPGAG